MFCCKCGSQIADDAKFCHNCGAAVVEEPRNSATAAKIEDNAKYDIVLIEVNTGEDVTENAHMAVAYVLFEDEIKKVSDGSSPDPEVKRQVQKEATRNAYEMAKNLPATIRRSVRQKEALFFKERLAMYGVTVLLGYCPDCGGSLSDMSDSCIICGQAAIELGDDYNSTSAGGRAVEQTLGETSVFCLRCGTLSQGDADFCRKCGSPTGA